jgi:hypothetical protein
MGQFTDYGRMMTTCQILYSPITKRKPYKIVYQRTRGPLGPVLKIIYRSWSVQDLKKTKRTSKDLIYDVFKVEAKIKALFLFGLCRL